MYGRRLLLMIYIFFSARQNLRKDKVRCCTIRINDTTRTTLKTTSKSLRSCHSRVESCSNAKVDVV